MAYNDDQFFYAALWFATTLDGAEALTDGICKAYGKKPIPLSPVKQPNPRHNGTPVTEDQFRTYFDTLYATLKDGRTERTHHTSSGRDGQFLKLSRAPGASRSQPQWPEVAFSPSVEAAIAASGIDRNAHTKGCYVYIHDTGDVFVNVTQADGPMTIASLDYPGKPPAPYRTLPAYTRSDMADTRLMVWEEQYRIVDLAPGQGYMSGYVGVDGKRYFSEAIADEGHALLVGNFESTVPLATLTDAEILAGSAKINGATAFRRDEFQPGFFDPDSRKWVEETSDPRIVSQRTGPVRVMDVTENIALHSGYSFAIAKPGDLIVQESAGSTPRVVTRGEIENGNKIFLPYAPPTPRKAAPKP